MTQRLLELLLQQLSITVDVCSCEQSNKAGGMHPAASAEVCVHTLSICALVVGDH
jgi:hypothetical protein